jgi:hypothetical protein
MRVTAISGADAASSGVMVGWAIVLATTAAIFIGTLMLRPKER